MKRIYLDHAATTPLDPRVFEAMSPYYMQVYGNPSSIHGSGREAKQALERAREVVATAIGAEPGEVYFTSGGTEADNLAVLGVLEEVPPGVRRLYVSPAEHHAVVDPALRARSRGTEVIELSPDPFGSITPEVLEASLGHGPGLVSVMHANNEIGTIAPVAKLAALTHAAGGFFHTDAVQSFGKIPVNVNTLGADLLTISAHKIYGPKGIGALYVRKGTPCGSILYGGGQERGRRPGTENVPAAIGFAKAVEIALEGMEQESARLRSLRDSLESEIRSALPGIRVNGDPQCRLPHLLSISFDSAVWSMEGEMLVIGMDLEGVACSSGSACTSGSVQPSHVLLAVGYDAATAKATLRFSFGRDNTGEDVGEVVRRLGRVLDRMVPRQPA